MLWPKYIYIELTLISLAPYFLAQPKIILNINGTLENNFNLFTCWVLLGLKQQKNNNKKNDHKFKK